MKCKYCGDELKSIWWFPSKMCNYCIDAKRKVKRGRAIGKLLDHERVEWDKVNNRMKYFDDDK